MTWLKIVVIAAVTCAALLIASSITRAQSGEELPINLDNAIFPRTKIIKVDDVIVRFDTATGELFNFEGTLQGSNANGLFRNIAPPVSGSNSGVLEVKRIGQATFLIDVLTGETWILRQNSPNNASW
ncbi:MAG: hypothetical protein L0219_22445, partial [Phycisphaerales bacterium]|nr:hypothetical protein [Phycisphaerales bacterium]